MRYLNNAGAALSSASTNTVVARHLQLEQELGAVEAAKTAKSEQDQFYIRAARLIKATDPSEIAFVDSASRAWNLALSAMALQKGDNIVTLSSEFGTNLVSLFYAAKQTGASVSVIPCEQDGSFDMSRFESAAKGAKLIAISHSAAHGSIVNPVIEIGQIAQTNEITYMVDGCQSLGQLDVDVNKIGCDIYTATGRKWLRGPRGTGFLYVRESAELSTTTVDLSSADLVIREGSRGVTDVTVRTDARRFELWERNMAGMLGLSNALKEAIDNDSQDVHAVIAEQGNRLRTVVEKNEHLSLMGKENSEVGNVGFYCVDPRMEAIIDEALQISEVVYSTMNDWDCPLHFPTNGATKIYRLSPHYYTDPQTVFTACNALSEA